MHTKSILLGLLLTFPLTVVLGQKLPPAAGARPSQIPTGKSEIKDYRKVAEKEWKSRLTPTQYNILREKGTERAFTGKYVNNHEKGIYRCAGCNQELFLSDTKFESGSGWPSFYKPMKESSVEVVVDKSHGMVREEVLCNRCGGHLGHVFPDGPKPTGLRYCLNSESLVFEKAKKP